MGFFTCVNDSINHLRPSPSVDAQGTVFSAIGFSAGITGTAVSNFLIFMRKQFDPNFKAQVCFAVVVALGGARAMMFFTKEHCCRRTCSLNSTSCNDSYTWVYIGNLLPESLADRCNTYTTCITQGGIQTRCLFYKVAKVKSRSLVAQRAIHGRVCELQVRGLILSNRKLNQTCPLGKDEQTGSLGFGRMSKFKQGEL
eukprot:1160545-Pelagomonas_calceolata.AAC.8